MLEGHLFSSGVIADVQAYTNVIVVDALEAVHKVEAILAMGPSEAAQASVS